MVQLRLEEWDLPTSGNTCTDDSDASQQRIERFGTFGGSESKRIVEDGPTNERRRRRDVRFRPLAGARRSARSISSFDASELVSNPVPISCGTKPIRSEASLPCPRRRGSFLLLRGKTLELDAKEREKKRWNPLDSSWSLSLRDPFALVRGTKRLPSIPLPLRSSASRTMR